MHLSIGLSFENHSRIGENVRSACCDFRRRCSYLQFTRIAASFVPEGGLFSDPRCHSPFAGLPVASRNFLQLVHATLMINSFIHWQQRSWIQHFWSCTGLQSVFLFEHRALPATCSKLQLSWPAVHHPSLIALLWRPQQNPCTRPCRPTRPSRCRLTPTSKMPACR